ncbi:jg6016, partial [Pararge aegeria aegeria]
MDSYGGVAILTHKSLKTEANSIGRFNDGIEVVHVKFFNCKYLKNVISVYCPSSVNTSQSDWEFLFSLCPKQSIIAGDFNGQHSSWSDRIDPRGNQLFDSCLQYGFISINDNSPTRIKLVNGLLQRSSPDITFCSSDIAVKMDWKVTNENLGSDHLVIKYTFNYESPPSFIKRRNFDKADWKDYKDILRNIFENFPLKSYNVQEMYDWFYKQLHLAAEKSIPVIKYCTDPHKSFVPKHFWNQKLSKIVAERRLALKNFRRNPIPDNLTILEQKVSEARLLIKQAESKGWHEFCDSLDESLSMTEVWRKMQWVKGVRRVKKCISNEKKQELLQTLTPDFVSSIEPAFTSKNEVLESNLTIHELDN